MPVKGIRPIKQKGKKKAAKQSQTSQILTVYKSSPQNNKPPPPSPSMVRAVCGLSNPFCTAARTQKYPDASAIRTLSHPIHERSYLNTDTFGNNVFMFHPQYAYSPLTSAGTISGTQALTWFNFASSASALSSTASYRIVTAGFVLRANGAPLYRSGMVHIRSWAPSSGSEYNLLEGTSYNASSSMDIPLADCKEVSVILQRSAMPITSFVKEVDDSATVIGFYDNGLSPVTIAISGAPVSATCIDIEWFINYEVKFDDAAGLAQLATAPQVPSSVLTTSAARVTSSMSTIFSKSLEAAERMVVRKATMAIASMIGGPVAGAVVGAVPRIVD